MPLGNEMRDYDVRMESTQAGDQTNYTARVCYVGEDPNLIEHLRAHGVTPDSMASVHMTVFPPTGKVPAPLIVSDPRSGGRSQHVLPPPAFRYHVYVFSLLNNRTQYHLDQRAFSVLRGLDGAGVGLLRRCLRDALDRRLVQPGSTIALDATPMSWIVLDESTARLVQYYERIGFR